jgi:hypothetical protein
MKNGLIPVNKKLGEKIKIVLTLSLKRDCVTSLELAKRIFIG